VVFNHTSEGIKGPTISFRGIDNSIYYILDDRKEFYKTIPAAETPSTAITPGEGFHS
jgi:pullulanase/glycogen debranching enzyme